MGKKGRLVAPGPGPEKHIEKSWQFLESKRCQADIDWWKAQFDTEPHFSSMNPRPSPEYVEGKNYGWPLRPDQYLCTSMPIRIPAETVNKISEAALEGVAIEKMVRGLSARAFVDILFKNA